jgi:mRNA interferase MazF
MKVQRGDIVLVDFPFSDRQGSKVRPALVVQADPWNSVLDDTILAVITSSRRRRLDQPTQVALRIGGPDTIHSGLRLDSVVDGTNLITMDQSEILTTIGRLEQPTMQLVDACLAESLGLAASR